MQKITIDFIKDLKKVEPTLSDETDDDLMCNRTQAVLKLDSDVLFLLLLKRPEIANQFMSLGINLGRYTDSFTEGGSSHDRGRLFSNVKFNQKKITTIDSPIFLKSKKENFLS